MALQPQKLVEGWINERSGQQVLPSAIVNLDILSLRSSTIASILCGLLFLFFSPCAEGRRPSL